jgi:hypothetical protein
MQLASFGDPFWSEVFVREAVRQQPRGPAEIAQYGLHGTIEKGQLLVCDNPSPRCSVDTPGMRALILCFERLRDLIGESLDPTPQATDAVKFPSKPAGYRH